MTIDEVISYNRLLADMETKSGDLEVAEYYHDTAKCLEELKEAKRLLKAAVDDLQEILHETDSITVCYHCIHRCDICYGDCEHDAEWTHLEEALKLIEKGEQNCGR